MTRPFKPLVRFHKKIELTHWQADKLAKIKFDCC